MLNKDYMRAGGEGSPVAQTGGRCRPLAQATQNHQRYSGWRVFFLLYFLFFLLYQKKKIFLDSIECMVEWVWTVNMPSNLVRGCLLGIRS